jgi:parallel beta-helix repeat protein
MTPFSKYMVTAISLLLGLGASVLPTLAQVQCGDTIGPNETVVLEKIILPFCTQQTGGIIVVGPATLDLNGFAIVGEGALGLAPPAICLTVLGKGAVIRNGDVAGCAVGIRVAGDGQHKLEKLQVTNHSLDYVRVESDKNTLTNNQVGNIDAPQGEDGIQVTGNKNKLLANEVTLMGRNGFAISGDKNQVRKNTATHNHSDGFGVGGNNNQLQKNTAIDNVDGYAVEDVANNILADNGAFDNRDDGFDIQGGTEKTTLRKNVAVKNSDNGFEIDGLEHKLTRNQARENQADGIEVETSASRIELKHNEALDNNQGNSVVDFDLTDQAPNCGTNTWTKNTFGTASQPCIQ